MPERLVGMEEVVYGCPLKSPQFKKDCEECNFFKGNQLHFYKDKDTGGLTTFIRIGCSLDNISKL